MMHNHTHYEVSTVQTSSFAYILCIEVDVGNNRIRLFTIETQLIIISLSLIKLVPKSFL